VHFPQEKAGEKKSKSGPVNLPQFQGEYSENGEDKRGFGGGPESRTLSQSVGGEEDISQKERKETTKGLENSFQQTHDGGRLTSEGTKTRQRRSHEK